MTQDLVQAINDGLHYYEEDLWTTNTHHRGSSGNYKTVNVVSQEVFEKLAPPAPKKQNPEVPPPPPPIVRLFFLIVLIGIYLYKKIFINRIFSYGII